jgi:hypothetical protein
MRCNELLLLNCQVLYATRPIKRGEELCDCYIELRQNTAERQRELNAYYRFTCSCSACTCIEGNTAGVAVKEIEGGILEETSVDRSINHNIENLKTETPATALSVFISVEPAAATTADTTAVTAVTAVTAGKAQQKITATTTTDDENRVAAMKLDKKMMKLAEEGQVQKALNCALKIIKVVCLAPFCSLLVFWPHISCSCMHSCAIFECVL